MSFTATIPTDSEGLASALFAHDRDTALLAVAVAEFDAGGEWEIAGFTSTIAWLRDLGLTHRDAAELLKIGQKLRQLPETAAAWVRGALSGGQVRVITAQVVDRHVPLFGEQEAALIPELVKLSVDETATAMRTWRERADALDDGPEPREEVSTAHLSPTLDDRGQLNASLDAEGFSLATAAFRVADSNDLEMPAPQRRGQALKDILRFFLDHQQLTDPRRHKPHVVVMVNGETLGTDHIEGTDAATGVRMASETLERLMCDCEMGRVVMAKGVILDFGRLVKTPSPELYQSIVARDRHCRWRGCDRPASWCAAHHVKWWNRDKGETNPGNLVLLCARHHGMIHRRGWSAVLYPNGDFQVTTPWRDVWLTRPPSVIGESLPPPKHAPPCDDPPRPYSLVDPFAHATVG